MAAKIPDFDKYYYEDICFFQNNDQVCVIISISTIPWNTRHNIYYINMVVELKMAAKTQDGRQILNCIIAALN